MSYQLEDVELIAKNGQGNSRPRIWNRPIRRWVPGSLVLVREENGVR